MLPLTGELWHYRTAKSERMSLYQPPGGENPTPQAVFNQKQNVRGMCVCAHVCVSLCVCVCVHVHARVCVCVCSAVSSSNF